MDLDEACRLHSSLAHALVGPWATSPHAQSVLQGELDRWRLRPDMCDEDFFETIRGAFAGLDIEPAIIEALRVVNPSDPFLQTMFEGVVTRTRQLYLRHADWPRSQVELELRCTRNPPYPDEGSYGDLGSAASVLPHEEGAATTATVKVTLCPSRLGPPSWACIPYLLCHEVVGHANQSVANANADPFTEGWMDVLARKCHSDWVAELFPWKPSLAIDAAESFCGKTRSLGPNVIEPHATTRAARNQGRAAAQWVLGILTPFSEAAGMDPWFHFERLCVQLNRVPSSLDEHLAFVGRIAACSVEPLEGRYSPHVLAVLRSWVEGGTTTEAVMGAVLSFT